MIKCDYCCALYATLIVALYYMIMLTKSYTTNQTKHKLPRNHTLKHLPYIKV